MLSLPHSRTSRAALLVVCLALIATSANSAGALADENWELEDSDTKAGWELYTAPVDGSDHRRYRLVSRSQEPVSRVAQALDLKLRDVKYMQKGFDRKILRSGDGFMINYVRMDVPVVSDRDVVLETRWWTDAETSAYHVSWAPPQGPLPPIPNGVSRIESRGSWEVSPLAGGGSKLVYTQHSELGNSIPTWLINRLMNSQIINEYVTLNEILSNDLPDVAAPPRRDHHSAAASSLVD